MQWVTLSLPDVPALDRFTGVLLAIGRIYLLCRSHSGVVALVLFFVYFSLVAADVEVAWGGVGGV